MPKLRHRLRRPCEVLIDAIPLRILREPERFTLALCFTVVGIDSVFFGAPSSIFAGVPGTSLINKEFGVCMLTGGIAKLIGLWRRSIWMQRFGAAFIIMGCLGLIFGVVLYVGKDGAPVAIIYGLFAVTYFFRLLSSTALRLKLHGVRKKFRGE